MSLIYKESKGNCVRVISSNKVTAFHTLDFKFKHFNLVFRSLFYSTGVVAFLGKLINIEFLLAGTLNCF